MSKNKSASGQCMRAKGKLINKYFNLKKLPIAILSTSQSANNENSENVNNLEEITDDVKESVEWLCNNEEPWGETELHWNKTFAFRCSAYYKKYNGKISSIYEEWPILTTPKGYLLIDIDFRLKKFSEIENAIDDFHTFYNEALEVRQLRADDHSDLLQRKLESENLNDGEFFKNNFDNLFKNLNNMPTYLKY